MVVKIFFPHLLGKEEEHNKYVAQYCRCDNWDKHPHVKAFCYNWFGWKKWPPYCKLNGGPMSKNCNGAIKMGNEYITADEAICNASKGEKKA